MKKRYANKYYAKNRLNILKESKLRNRHAGGNKCEICGYIFPIEVHGVTKYCDKCMKNKKTSRQARWYRKNRIKISKLRKKEE